jgi:radical SAM superfamily enzyme YgiQ (UPF0313 family)
MRVLFVSANREQLPSPVVPLGLLTVAATARPRHEVVVEDLCFTLDTDDALATLRAALERTRPDVVAVGVRNLRDNAYRAEGPLAEYHAALGRCVREATTAPLVIGGAAVTLQPAGMLERTGARHAVIGEGERAFPALLDALARGEVAPAFVQATPGPLDELPRAAWDLADPRYFQGDGTVSVQTKRGCAFSCTYCDYPDLEGRSVRVRDPQRVADEVVALARMPGASHLFFVDSVFNAPRAHARAVCEALIARGAPVPWVCYASPAGLDDELVATMARAGCVGAEIGTDAGTDVGLRRLRKPFDLAQVRRVRASFRAHGLLDCHSFVLGAEGETADEAAATLAFVDELDPDLAVFLVFAEDREALVATRDVEHRAALRALLAREGPKHPGWIVPELGVRFGPKVTRIVRQRGLRGPSWLHLAKARRDARG